MCVTRVCAHVHACMHACMHFRTCTMRLPAEEATGHAARLHAAMLRHRTEHGGQQVVAHVVPDSCARCSTLVTSSLLVTEVTEDDIRYKSYYSHK